MTAPPLAPPARPVIVHPVPVDAVPNSYDELTAIALAEMRRLGLVLMTRADVAATFGVSVGLVDRWVLRRDQGRPLDPHARFPNPAGYTVSPGRGAFYLWPAVKAWGIYTGREFATKEKD